VRDTHGDRGPTSLILAGWQPPRSKRRGAEGGGAWGGLGRTALPREDGDLARHVGAREVVARVRFREALTLGVRDYVREPARVPRGEGGGGLEALADASFGLGEIRHPRRCGRP
jgi:hypothetical protein